MQPPSMQEMHKEATRRLFEYRQSAAYLRAEENPDSPAAKRRALIGASEPLSAEEKARLRAWKRVIEKVQRYYAEADPEMERFMVRYFALRTPINRRMAKRARHFAIMAEFNVSDSTVYKWKMKIVETTVLFAAQERRGRLF